MRFTGRRDVLWQWRRRIAELTLREGGEIVRVEDSGDADRDEYAFDVELTMGTRVTLGRAWIVEHWCDRVAFSESRRKSD